MFWSLVEPTVSSLKESKMSLSIPDLDNKNFSQIIEEVKARLPALAPGWTDYNLSDPGITILELLAWLTDIEIYRLNRITEKHILKFLKLLNSLPEPVKPARTWVTFSLPEDYNDVIHIPQGTRLTATEKDISLYFETIEDIYVHPVKIKKIVLSNERGITEYNENSIPQYFYAFGEEAKKGSCFYIGFDKPLKGKFSLTFILYEDDLPPIGKHGKESPEITPSAEIEWSYWDGNRWAKLKSIKDKTLHLFQNGSVIFKEISNMQKRQFPLQTKEELFFIRCKLKKEGYEIVPRIKKILINTTKAIQIEKVLNKKLGKSNGFPNQTFSLKKFPIVSSDYFKMEFKIKYFKDETEITEVWEEVDNLSACTHKDKVFKVDRKKGIIIFGDGINGKIPPANSTIFCSYAVSKGRQGNISERCRWQLLDDIKDTNKLFIENQFPASEGSNPETIEEAFLRFKKDLLTPYQAVTANDYEFLALNTPGLRVARAKAIGNSTLNQVKVVVVPFSLSSRPYPSKGFLKTVCYHLDKHRLITTKVEVVPPEYAVISVLAKIKTKDEADPEQVIKRAKASLHRFFHPLYGWKDGKGWPFGKAVYLSDVYTVLEGVEGLDCVFDVEIKAEGAYLSHQDRNVILKENALTTPGTHSFSVFITSETCRR